jgi:uncharacterized protein YqhQ
MPYSLASLLQEYSKNKEIIHAYMQNKTVEGYEDSDSDTTVAYIGVGVFIAILIVSLIIWIWALVVTIKYWDHLPAWARVVSVLGLIPIIPGGPIVTLVVVYIARGSSRGRRGKKSRRKN